MSIPRPHINEESELDHRVTVHALGPAGLAQAWDASEVVAKNLLQRIRAVRGRVGVTLRIREFQLWELYGLDERYWAYRLVHK